ncbi:MAG: hypothetical protein DI548_09490 [Flavobacterium johnsoniae]|nr:MAG: hypothetical protein DI548_09490 [Flavobacterium johnsoniae]
MNPRAASTATTAGIGNNVVATTETAGAGLMSVLAIFLPVIAFIFAIALIVLVLFFGRKLWKKLKANNSGIF